MARVQKTRVLKKPNSTVLEGFSLLGLGFIAFRGFLFERAVLERFVKKNLPGQLVGCLAYQLGFCLASPIV